MAKEKLDLQGKEVLETLSLGGGLTMIKFTDGSFIVVAQHSDPIEASEVGFEAGEAEDDEEEEDEESEEEDEDEEEDPDEEEEDDEEESEDDEEEEELTADDLVEMDFDDLEDVVDDYELEVDVEDFDDDADKLRKAVAKELDIKLPKGKKGGKKKKK